MMLRSLLFSLCLSFSLVHGENTHEPPLKLSIERHTLYVNGTALYIKGVSYNPASLGTAPAWTPPWGDYLQAQFADVWARDFPLIKAMGANTVRVWQWNNDNDHGAFLDAAHRAGLYVIITFYIGNAYQFPVQQEWQRQQLLGTFKWQVQRYAHHPAIIAWSFGGELNAPWNSYLQAFSNAYGCGWGPQCLNDGSAQGQCYGPIVCLYSNLFGFLNTAAQYAKQALGGHRSHLILGGLADVDRLTLRLKHFEHISSDIDGWGVQIYRGKDFVSGDDDFVHQYNHSSAKPLVVTEFGVDAYNDPCGTQDTSPCLNFPHNAPSGYGEDEAMQAEWLRSQVKILYANSSASGNGPVAGAVIYEWLDEYWRSTTGVTGCYGPIPYGQPGFDQSLCDWKAHVDCPESDLWYHSLCGYQSNSFDKYTNVAWFGLMKVFPNPGHDMDKIVARQAYDRVKELWGEPEGFLWLYLTLLALLLSLALAGLLYIRWTKRVNQLEAVGVGRKSLFSFSDYRAEEEYGEHGNHQQLHHPHAGGHGHSHQPSDERTPLIRH